jgi:hypothetical protein
VIGRFIPDLEGFIRSEIGFVVETLLGIMATFFYTGVILSFFRTGGLLTLVLLATWAAIIMKAVK